MDCYEIWCAVALMTQSNTEVHTSVFRKNLIDTSAETFEIHSLHILNGESVVHSHVFNKHTNNSFFSGDRFEQSSHDD